MALIQKLTYQDLKAKIGCQNIFEHYFGNFTFNESYHSPLRQDEKKSVGFFINNNGSVIYNDFAEDKKYNCVNFVQKLYKLNYYEAIEHIAKTFGLIEGGLKQVIPIKPITVHKKKQKSTFKVVTRPFTKTDLLWWKSYSITKQELTTNKVYSVASLTINNYTTYTARNELKFAYLLYDDAGNGYFKIYTPLSIERKWMFNGANNLVYGLANLKFITDTLIITKSVKDYIILKKFFPDVVALQHEGKAAISAQTINALKKYYANIYIWMDSDRPGIKAANFYKKTYGLKPILLGSDKLNIWKNIRQCKKNKTGDPADFVKKYGLDNFKKWLTQNKLYEP